MVKIKKIKNKKILEKLRKKRKSKISKEPLNDVLKIEAVKKEKKPVKKPKKIDPVKSLKHQELFSLRKPKLPVAKKGKKAKKIKLKFPDDTKKLGPGSYLSKIAYVAVVVVSFYIGKIGILDTTINNALKIEGDLTVKQSFLDTGAKTIKTIKDREQKAIEDFEETKKIYFNNSEPETFYEFLTRIALRHGVEIVELNKLKEEPYRDKSKAKPSAQAQQQGQTQQQEQAQPAKTKSSDYILATYRIKIEGNFVDYKNFIAEIKSRNKGILTRQALLEKIQNKEDVVSVQTDITLNYIKS